MAYAVCAWGPWLQTPNAPTPLCLTSTCLPPHLGVGGTLTALCRVSSGDFHVRDAWHIEDLVARFNQEDPTS